MKKITLTLLAVASMLVTSLVFSTGNASRSEVNVEMPLIVNPGDEFMVQLSIHKSNWNNTAVLQYFLPEGFSAAPIESAGANFSFENNTIRLSWERSPAENVLHIACRIKTPLDYEGLCELKGALTYIDNDRHYTSEVPVHILNVTNALETENVEHAVRPAPEMSVSRSVTTPGITAESGREVKVLIKTNGIKGSGMYFEKIPEGFSTLSKETSGATVLQKGNSLQYTWQELPAGTEIKLSYDLVESPGNLNGLAAIQGMFVVKEGDLLLAVTSAAVGTGNSAENLNNTPSLTMPLPTIYKVQVAATRHSPNRDAYFFYQCCQLSKAVERSEENGWNKYCFGSYSNYAAAKNAVLGVRNTIPDAFVVAYKNGKRVPVEITPEDLLSINQ